MWPSLNRFLGAGLMGTVRIWSRVKVKFWPRSRVKAENWGSKSLTPVAGGSMESTQPTSPCSTCFTSSKQACQLAYIHDHTIRTSVYNTGERKRQKALLTPPDDKQLTSNGLEHRQFLGTHKSREGVDVKLTQHSP